MTPEGRNVAYLKKAFKAIGGECRKCHWEGRVGAPDILVLLKGRHFFIEVKAPGKKPEKYQEREITRLKSAGFAVFVVDSPEAIDNLIKSLLNG